MLLLTRSGFVDDKAYAKNPLRNLRNVEAVPEADLTVRFSECVCMCVYIIIKEKR